MKGEPATRTTRAEFEALVMADIPRIAKELQKKHPELYSNGMWLSMDNAKYHPLPQEKLRVRGLPIHRVVLPALSHDLHKVVEHSIHTHKAAASEWLYDNPRVTRVADIKKAFVELFHAKVTKEGVSKDVESLKYTYHCIAASKANGGTEGDWAPPRLR